MQAIDRLAIIDAINDSSRETIFSSFDLSEAAKVFAEFSLWRRSLTKFQLAVAKHYLALAATYNENDEWADHNAFAEAQLAYYDLGSCNNRQYLEWSLEGTDDQEIYDAISEGIFLRSCDEQENIND